MQYAHKAVVNVRLSGQDCDALRAITQKDPAAQNAPVSLAATVRGILREFIRINGGGAGSARGQYEHQQS